VSLLDKVFTSVTHERVEPVLITKSPTDGCDKVSQVLAGTVSTDGWELTSGVIALCCETVLLTLLVLGLSGTWEFTANSW
jgi:hypothetical protein